MRSSPGSPTADTSLAPRRPWGPDCLTLASLSSPLSCQPASVHGDGGAVDVGGGFGGQVDYRALEILRLAPAACRDTREEGLTALGVAAQRARQRGREVARGYGVHVDT